MSTSLNGSARGAELCGIVQNLQNQASLLPLLMPLFIRHQYHVLKCILIVANTHVSHQNMIDAQIFQINKNRLYSEKERQQDY
jgi:hypothetical protein